ncbi:MAG: MFS transporter [Cytophagia bacterium]|nr:MFS transporter [Cytophagia bacterium]
MRSPSFSTVDAGSGHALSTPWRSFLTLIGVFFFWGFVAASNDILIPVFKQALNLEQAQSQMISFAFYVAYTLGSLLYLGASALWSGPGHDDLISRWGYSKALSYGLLISAVGTLLFIPAANHASFPLLLAGLMVVGLGFSLQQTVANPLVLLMGPSAGGSQRLSMAGGINNLGTTLGPLLVSYAIFGPMTGEGSGAASSESVMDLSSVKTPYLVLGVLFTLAAFVFYFKDLGRPTPSQTTDSSGGERRRVFALPQVWGGMIAIFLYVGVEVATASNLPEYLRAELHLPVESFAPYVALYWASLMIGRWTGTAAMVRQGVLGMRTSTTRTIMRLVLPASAFGVYMLVTALGGHDPREHVVFLPALLVLVAADAYSGGRAERQLALYAGLGMVSLILGMVAPPQVGVYALTAVGLFCSTLWPCIFDLSLRGVGSATTKVSSALIMMIMGGGFVSVLQGYLADLPSVGIRGSFWVGVVCFAYLAFYALVLARPRNTSTPL